MFVGEKLTDIRQLYGLSRNELAKLLEVSEQSVWQYENNYTGPKLEVVNKLKSIFDVKSRYFYNKESHKTYFEPSLIAYRSKALNSIAKTRNEAVHLGFVEGLLNIFETYVVYPENKLVFLREKCIQYLNENDGVLDRQEIVKQIAEFTRKDLELGKDNQKLLYTLEMNGAFVVEKTLRDDVDAYSTWSSQDRPIIILGNTKKSAVRRNFDLAHELGHLLLHHQVDLSDLNKLEYKKVEEEAHDFASFFLMPEKEFLNDFKQIRKRSNPKSYIEMKEKWKVSIVAMAYYARKLGVLTYDQYRYFHASLNRLDYTRGEPLDGTIKIIKPGKVKSSIQFLFEEKIMTLQQLTEITHYNHNLIAKILGLDECFVNSYLEKEPPFFGITHLNRKMS